MDDITSRHNGFGILDISRVTGGNPNLFGSSIEHSNKITIRISQGEHSRHLSHDWYRSIGVPIIEIEMSPVQYAEAITNMNTMGVPCTIKYIQGKKVDDLVIENKRKQIDGEFEKQVLSINTLSQKIIKETTEKLNKPSLTKGDRQEIIKLLNKLNQEVEKNIPFIKEQFTGQMDKTVSEAKSEYEAYVQHQIITLGLDEFKKQQFKELTNEN